MLSDEAMDEMFAELQSGRMRGTKHQDSPSKADVSSAEEEHQKRILQRRKPKPKPKPLTSQSSSSASTDTSEQIHIVPPPDSKLAHMVERQQVERLPDVRNMEELQKDFPHLGNDTITGKPICDLVQYKFLTQRVIASKNKHIPKKQAEQETETDRPMLTDLEIAAQHAQDAVLDPWQLELMRSKFKRLFIPTFYHSAVSKDDLPQERLHTLLRRKTLVLPLLKASLESALLVEAGQWYTGPNHTLMDFPPCSNGQQCVGFTCEFPEQTRKFVLTATMFPQEYEMFLKHRHARGVVRPCIACLRYTLVDWVTYLRSTKTSGSCTDKANASSVFFAPNDEVYQLYYNLADCDGGYFSECMTRPDSSCCEAIIEPMCRLNRSFMVARSHESGQMYLDQGAIVWRSKPAPIPRIGENLSLF